MAKARALTKKQVKQVFEWHATGDYTMQAIADFFGVSRTLISRTLSGKKNQGTVIPNGNYKRFKIDGASYLIYDDGRVFSVKHSKFLSPAKTNGYLYVKLGPNERKRYIQRLVLTYFVGKPKAGQEACHNNGIRTDNRLKNLRWGTRSENNKDKQQHKTAPNGSKNHKSVLPDRLVSHLLFAVRYSEYSLWEFSEQMAEHLNFNAHTIYSALKRKHFNDGVLDKWNSTKKVAK